mmetsp:Transcript_18003/g.31563  ORF Transcript_18003/g.31563 Transcript_18003/m.31563 type:complete len:302 (-) Transcript_18003:699-1604(-)
MLQVIFVLKSSSSASASFQENGKAHPPQLSNCGWSETDTGLTRQALSKHTHLLQRRGEDLRGLQLAGLRPSRGARGAPRESILALVQKCCNIVHCLLGIAEQHPNILQVEQWVIYSTVACTHGTFHHNARLALPDLNGRHAIDWTAWVVLRRRVHDVVGANDNANIVASNFGIDVFHLPHNVVGNVCLGQKHVHVPWHSAGNRVNCKVDNNVVFPQRLHNLCKLLLAASNGQAVARHNHHLLCAIKEADKANGRDFSDTLSTSRGTSSGGSAAICAEATQQHVVHGSIDATAHDIAQESTT